jgi:endonuclease-3
VSPATRAAIYRRLRAANPAPTTELLHSTPFELLVAVMLSAHTTDKSVNAATRNLFPVANTPAAIAALGVEGVKPYIRTVGLYNTKAANLVGLARQILEQHGGEVPGDRPALEALPGVGRKRSLWTRISSAWRTAPDSPRARHRVRSRTVWSQARRPSSARTRTIG